MDEQLTRASDKAVEGPDNGPSSDRRLIARNASTSYAFRIVLGLSVLLLTPYLFRKLGAGGFGTWSVMYTVASVFELLELGFSAGVTKLSAELRAKGRREELNETVGASVVLLGALGFVGLALCLGLAFLASGLAPGEERDAFQVGMIAIGAALLLRSPFSAYGATLLGYQRYDYYNGSRIVTTVGFAVAAVIAVEAGAGVLGLALAYAAALLIDAVLFCVLLARVDPNLALRPRRSTRARRRSVTRISSYVLLAESMNFIAQRMDTLVIAAVRNAASAGPYAAALKLQTGVQSLTLPFVYLLMPMVSDLSARGMSGEVVRRLILATRVSVQITLPVAAALALFSEDVIGVWLGEGAPAVTAQILIVLMAVQTVTLFAAPAEKVLVGMGKVRAVGVIALIEGFSNLALSITLVSIYGAIGAALGTLLTSAVLAPLKIPLVCRATGSSVWSFLRVGVLPAVASSALGIGAMACAWMLLPPGLGRLTLGGLGGLGVCAAVAIVQIGPRNIVAMVRTFTRRPNRRRGGLEVAWPDAERP